MKRLIAALLVGALMSVSMLGCHTVKGAGRDIQSGGRAVEGAAERAK